MQAPRPHKSDPTRATDVADAARQRDAVQRAFGAVLRRLRDDHQMSQEDLAAESGVGRSFIARMETGKRQPTITTLVRLAKAFGVAPSAIMAAVEQEGGGF